MTQEQFNWLCVYGTEEEFKKARDKYPDLVDGHAEIVEHELKESTMPQDENYYQRMIDHGVEDIETYDIHNLD